jgi:hypothetical protein
MPEANLLPVSDKTEAEWSTEPPKSPGDDHECIDHGTSGSGYTPEDTSFLYTSTDAAISGFVLATPPADVETVTEVSVNIRAKIEDPGTGDPSCEIHLKLYKTGGVTQIGSEAVVTTTNLGGVGVLGECTKTWTGLSLTAAEVAGLVVTAELHLTYA